MEKNQSAAVPLSSKRKRKKQRRQRTKTWLHQRIQVMTEALMTSGKMSGRRSRSTLPSLSSDVKKDIQANNETAAERLQRALLESQQQEDSGRHRIFQEVLVRNMAQTKPPAELSVEAQQRKVMRKMISRMGNNKIYHVWRDWLELVENQKHKEHEARLQKRKLKRVVRAMAFNKIFHVKPQLFV